MLVKELVPIVSSGINIMFFREADQKSYDKYFSQFSKLKEAEANAEVTDIYSDCGIRAEAFIRK